MALTKGLMMSGDAETIQHSAAIDQSSIVPSPGSDGALDRGCTCPVLDNGRGRGYMGQPGIFVFNATCPIHGVDAAAELP